MTRSKTGYFLDVQAFSVNDGEGIRTNVFLAGCPLSCAFCSNPECNHGVNRVSYYKKLCIGCGACVRVCPVSIAIDLNEPENRKRCIECGKCVEVCPTAARRKLVNVVPLDEIVEFVDKYSIFYRYSGGGVTFSGGEPTQQIAVLRELTDIFYDRGYDLAIETSGYFNFDSIKDVLAKMDLIFMDIKHMDNEEHIKLTEVSNKRILENVKNVGNEFGNLVVRIPVIEGVNGTDENVRATAEFLKENIPNPKIELLPYHTLASGKYEALGLKIAGEEFQRPSSERIKELETMVSSSGVEVVSYK